MFSLRAFLLCGVGVAVFFILFALPSGVQPVLACNPTEPPPNAPIPTPISMESRVNSVPLIFSGTVVKTHGSNSGTTVKVSQYFKGTGSSSVIVYGFGGSAACEPEIQVGDSGIFYTSETFHLIHISYNPGDFAINEVIQLVGHEPLVLEDVKPVVRSPASQNALPAFWLLIVILLLILAAIGIILWQKFKSARSL